MNMEVSSQSQNAYQEIIVWIGDATYAIDHPQQKASLGLSLEMSHTAVRDTWLGIETNKIVHRNERFQRVCGPIPGEIGELFVPIFLLEPYRIRLKAEKVHRRATAARLPAYFYFWMATKPICADVEVAVNWFLGETYTYSVISQQICELRSRLLPDDDSSHCRAANRALVARLLAISKGNKKRVSQTCNARFITRPTVFSGVSLLGAQPNDIADEKGTQA